MIHVTVYVSEKKKGVYHEKISLYQEISTVIAVKTICCYLLFSLSSNGYQPFFHFLLYLIIHSLIIWANVQQTSSTVYGVIL